MKVYALLASAILLGAAGFVQAQDVEAPVVVRITEERAETAIPTNNPGSWVTSGDYPPSALRTDTEGVVAFVITVGPDGAPLECQITESSGTPELDQTACEKILERAQFAQVKDAGGNPVTGVYASRVRFQIPGSVEALPPVGTMAVTFTVNADGTVTDCVVESAMSRPSPACSSMPVFEPPLNEDGEPERRRYRTIFSVETVPLEDAHPE